MGARRPVHGHDPVGGSTADVCATWLRCNTRLTRVQIYTA